MDPVRRKALGRSMPQRGKAKRISRTESFLRRQRSIHSSSTTSAFTDCYSGDKTWLETHIWHAKRMHMNNIWGYRLVHFVQLIHNDPNAAS